MHRPLWKCLAAGCVLLFGACSPPVDEADPVCEAFVQKQLAPAPITYGSPAPTLLSLTPGQQLAVGALLLSDRSGGFANGCTGTLVAPDVVITAAHCVWGRRGPRTPDRLRFGIGPDMDAPQRVFLVSEIHAHPDYDATGGDASSDVAILRLSENVLEAVPELVPLTVNRDPLGQELVGSPIQVVGYGLTESDDENTRKFWTTEHVSDVTPTEVVVDGRGQSAVCYGDSGGPLLLGFPDGSVRVIGVLSWGDPSCLDEDHFGRVDPHVSWLESEAVAGSLQGWSCGALTEAGSCDGVVRRWCEAGAPREVDCASTSEVCLVTAGVAGCGVDPCAGYDFKGACLDGTATWCEGSNLKRFDCSACGWSCEWLGDALGHGCRVE